MYLCLPQKQCFRYSVLWTSKLQPGEFGFFVLFCFGLFIVCVFVWVLGVFFACNVEISISGVVFFLCALYRFSAIFYVSLKPPLFYSLTHRQGLCWDSSSPLLMGKLKAMGPPSPSNAKGLIMCTFSCSPCCLYVFPFGEGVGKFWNQEASTVL